MQAVRIVVVAKMLSAQDVCSGGRVECCCYACNCINQVSFRIFEPSLFVVSIEGSGLSSSIMADSGAGLETA